MKLGTLKKISREDLSRAGELPKWVDLLMQPINDFIEKLGQAVQGQLTFEDNFLCKIAYMSLTHATLTEVSPYVSARQRNLRVKGVLLSDSGGLAVDTFQWARKENGNLSVRVNYDGGLSTTTADCALIILLG